MVSDSEAMDTDNEPPRNPTHVDQEPNLIYELQHVVSGQKATFCCGGSVPIITDSDEAKEHRFDDVAGLIKSPPVVLRWDLPGGMYVPISYLATHSLLIVLSKLEGLSLQTMRVGFQRSLVFQK